MPFRQVRSQPDAGFAGKMFECAGPVQKLEGEPQGTRILGMA